MRISGLLVMAIMFTGILLLIWAASGLVLSRFKSSKYKAIKYDVTVTALMMIFMESYLIKFFVTQYNKYNGMDYVAVIVWMYIIIVIPYNIYSSLVSGVRGKWVLVSTLCGSIISSLIIIVSVNIF